MGSQMNKYNACTFNKMINGYQCTIQVHVDDLKLSHVQQEELNKIINQLNDVFRSDGELLTASYRKVHKYLGMTIDWTTEGNGVFTMYDYLKNILAEAPLDFDGEDVTPTISERFSMNATHRKLDTTMVDLFHCIIARFLQVAKRVGPDLQAAVTFLCKQVKCPNISD